MGLLLRSNRLALALPEDFVFDLRQKFASDAVIQAPRHRHSREHAVQGQLHALLVQLVRHFSELRDFVRVSLSDHCGTVLSKAFADLLTLIWKVFVQFRRVISVSTLEGF